MSKQVNKAGKVVSIDTSSAFNKQMSVGFINKAIEQGFIRYNNDIVTRAIALNDCIRLYITPSCYLIIKADEAPIEITLHCMSK